MKSTPDETCFSCGMTESDVPLIQLKFEGRQIHICPQCLPVLIHHPEKLEGKLEK